jgi:hypothetical protein
MMNIVILTRISMFTVSKTRANNNVKAVQGLKKRSIPIFFCSLLVNHQ